ncbi:MAG: hypothetical protein ABSC94_22530 [Polyangiaceae bacterium]
MDHPITAGIVRELAEIAECDAVTVWKRLAGASAESGAIRRKVQARIDRAIDAWRSMRGDPEYEQRSEIDSVR